MDLSETQLKAVNELRSRISNVLKDDYEESDAYLCKWLCRCNFDVFAAERSLRNHDAWKSENRIATILSEDTSELYAKFPMDVMGFDKRGYPIMLMTIGDWNVNKHLKEGGRAELVRYTMKKQIEAVVAARKQWLTTNGAIDQYISIVDMAGISFKNVASAACISLAIDLSRTLDANYPGVFKESIVINAPKYAAIMFRAIKPFLSPESRLGFRVFDSNEEVWKRALLKFLEPNQIPNAASK